MTARVFLFVLLGALLASGASANAQEQQQINPGAMPLAVVHGVVRNVVSGEPLPRVLVRIEGDASTGVLTDGDGRFEIADLPSGPQMFEVIKPGFLDAAAHAGNAELGGNPGDYAHNVFVIENMPELTFNMTPVNSIRGQVQLSTGDSAQAIGVILLRKSVQDGRSIWQQAATARTNSEGVYHFGELADGLYAVYTEPTMDSDAATNLVENGSGNYVARQGYSSVFYPDAHDLAGAAKIHVAGGDQVQANIALTLEPFQLVTARVAMPRMSSGSGENVSVQVLDAQGHQLPYTAQYDGNAHTVDAWLPDGSYTFLAALIPNLDHIMSDAYRMGLPRISGQVTFAVAGHAVSNLRIPMTNAGSSSIQVSISHSPDSLPQAVEPQVYITLSQAGEWISDGTVSAFAEGKISVLAQTAHPPAGSYWVHTSIAPKALCESSLTSGGASLAREPLVITDSRTAVASLVLSLRDDCARLTLKLPESVGLAAGEERFYTVYAVPDSGSTQDAEPQTLRPSTGGRITLTGLTPGNYHVYTFDRPVGLEYRNPAVLAALPSQAVTLAPGAETELTVEARQP